MYLVYMTKLINAVSEFNVTVRQHNNEKIILDCTLDLSDPESPLIVNEDYTLPMYDLDRNHSLSFESDDLFYAVCTAGTHSPYIVEEGDHLICKGDTNVFNIRTMEMIEFANIKCRPHGPAIVNKLDLQCGTNNGTLYEIGFHVYRDFLSMISVCFDEVKLTPIYSKYNYSFLFGTQRSAEIKAAYEESVVCGGVPCEG
ncbi:hypothetical protein Zmor_022539 [Zophobas morio]|uniref:Uncharacterized protein n=1 Tax=Zophobas morio TaxID=2755281 RepID=A0AA38HX19_9CUCU|nr:hypothetical protein Zmor_022539 [Zophobas morio]